MSRFGHFYTVSYTICPFSETSLISLLKTALDIKELDYEHLIRILMLQVLYWQWLLLQQAMLGMAHHSDLLDVFWVVSTKLNMQILCCAPTLLPYSLQKCLEWHILIISVSATCNIDISWFDFSDLWTDILWYCLLLGFACTRSLWLLSSVCSNQRFCNTSLFAILLRITKFLISGSSSLMASVLSKGQEVLLSQ